MFRIFQISLLLIFVAFTSCNTSKKTVKTNESPNHKNGLIDTSPKEKSLLWKIEGNGLTEASYLYGTIHIIPSEDYFLPEGTLGAIDATEKMVFEIDVDEMNSIGAQFKLLSKARMKDGISLQDLITADEYQLVNDHFNKMGLPLAMFDKMKPAFLTIFASPGMDPMALQSGEMKSYEMELNEIAKSKKMKTGGLETMEYQMGLFDVIPYEDQAKELVEAIKNGSEGSDELDKLIQIYIAQDLQAMEEMFSEEEVMGDTDALLDNRNRNWIPLIQEMSAKQPTFYAVGAGHLVGDQGVISLLRKAGYTVTAINE